MSRIRLSVRFRIRVKFRVRVGAYIRVMVRTGTKAWAKARVMLG
jgi:hypothetical protein